jgi:hypothetical protein
MVKRHTVEKDVIEEDAICIRATYPRFAESQ